MTNEHLSQALEALEFQQSKFEENLRRTPKTRDRKPNIMWAHWNECLSKINEAHAAISAHLTGKE